MQYTGLHDKNGKEIYEGDIVESYALSIGGFDHVKIKVRGIVEFRYNRWFINKIWAEIDRDSGRVKFLEYNNHIEILGNIYANPELLKD